MNIDVVWEWYVDILSLPHAGMTFIIRIFIIRFIEKQWIELLQKIILLL